MTGRYLLLREKMTVNITTGSLSRESHSITNCWLHTELTMQWEELERGQISLSNKLAGLKIVN